MYCIWYIHDCLLISLIGIDQIDARNTICYALDILNNFESYTKLHDHSQLKAWAPQVSIVNKSQI